MNRKRIGVLALLSMAMPTSGLFAAEPTNAELYQMLLEMKKELAETKAENQDLKRSIQAGAATAVTPAAPGVDDYDETQAVRDQPVRMGGKFQKSYLEFESADGNFQYKIDGRVMLDAGMVSNDKDDNGENRMRTNTEFRRARLALKTKMYKDWAGEFDIDFAGSGEDLGHIEIKDMWASYNGFTNTVLKLGNHKPHFSMDEVTTSRWSTFLETSMVSSEFAPGRRIGFSGSHWQDRFMVGASVFGDEYGTEPTDLDADDEDDDDGVDDRRSERPGFSVRGIVRPIVMDDYGTILHLGANYMNHQPQSDSTTVKYNVTPEAHFLDYKFLDTGKIKDVDDTSTWGLELAGKWKRFMGQAEYLESTVNTGDGPDPDFDGWYVMGSYFLTDDQRPYSMEDGEFGPVVPNGKWGALEVALRYSTLDLNDQGAEIFGGEADNITIGLNWYINNNFIIKANYINADLDNYASGDGDYTGGDDLDIYGVRFEYLF